MSMPSFYILPSLVIHATTNIQELLSREIPEQVGEMNPIVSSEFEFRNMFFQLEHHREEHAVRSAPHALHALFQLPEFMILSPSPQSVIKASAPWSINLPTIQSAMNIAAQRLELSMPVFVVGRDSDGPFGMSTSVFTGRHAAKAFFADKFNPDSQEREVRLFNGVTVALPITPLSLWNTAVDVVGGEPQRIAGRESLTVTTTRAAWTAPMEFDGFGPTVDPVSSLDLSFQWPKARAGSFSSFTVVPDEAPVWSLRLQSIRSPMRLTTLLKGLLGIVRSTSDGREMPDVLPTPFTAIPPMGGSMRTPLDVGIKAAPLGSCVLALAIDTAMSGRVIEMASKWKGFVSHLVEAWDERDILEHVGLDPPLLDHSMIFQRVCMVNIAIAEYNRNPARYEGVSRRFTENDEADTGTTDEVDPTPDPTPAPPAVEWGDDLSDLSDSDSTISESSSAFMSASDTEAALTSTLPPGRGAVAALPGVFLLHHPSRPLNIPRVQPPAPISEEKLILHEQVLAELAAPDMAHVRERFHSSQLLCDMQAFKAANPGAILADFIRWYSPNDWIPARPVTDSVIVDVDVSEELVKLGITEQMVRNARNVVGFKLSPRMDADGGIWKTLWEGAEPLAADEQQPLFDAVGEAETTLSALDAMAPFDVASELFWTLFFYVYKELERIQLISQIETDFDSLKDFIKTHIRSTFSGIHYRPALAVMDHIVGLTETVEHQLAVYASLSAKLDDKTEATRQLVKVLARRGVAFVEAEARAAVEVCIGAAMQRPTQFTLFGEAEAPSRFTFKYELQSGRRATHLLAMTVGEPGG